MTNYYLVNPQSRWDESKLYMFTRYHSITPICVQNTTLTKRMHLALTLKVSVGRYVYIKVIQLCQELCSRRALYTFFFPLSLSIFIISSCPETLYLNEETPLPNEATKFVHKLLSRFISVISICLDSLAHQFKVKTIKLQRQIMCSNH